VRHRDTMDSAYTFSCAQPIWFIGITVGDLGNVEGHNLIPFGRAA
jgi:hypothetical protein